MAREASRRGTARQAASSRRAAGAQRATKDRDARLSRPRESACAPRRQMADRARGRIRCLRRCLHCCPRQHPCRRLCYHPRLPRHGHHHRRPPQGPAEVAAAPAPSLPRALRHPAGRRDREGFVRAEGRLPAAQPSETCAGVELIELSARWVSPAPGPPDPKATSLNFGPKGTNEVRQ